MTPLITSETASSTGPREIEMGRKDEANCERTYGTSGASIANPASAQATRLISDHSWRIIRALLLAVKSAPLKPKFNPMEPKAKIRNTPSKIAIIAISSDGWKKAIPIAVVIILTAMEKNTKKAYLLFTKFLGEIGEA